MYYEESYRHNYQHHHCNLYDSLSGCSHKEKDYPLEISSQLQNVSRLELARMTVGKVGMISDPEYKDAKSIEAKASALLNRMKIGTRLGVYSYDTYIVAYLDLSKVSSEDVEVDTETGTAYLTLPPIEIMTDGREPQLHEVHSRVTGLRSSITPSERASLKSQMAKEVKKEMSAKAGATDHLRKAAEDKARAYLTELISNWGYKAEISFK